MNTKVSSGLDNLLKQSDNASQTMHQCRKELLSQGFSEVHGTDELVMVTPTVEDRERILNKLRDITGAK